MSPDSIKAFVESRKTPTLLQQVVRAVNENPGLTDLEMAAVYRFTDSRHLGRNFRKAARRQLITQGPSRRCGVSGKTAATWLPFDGKPYREPMTDMLVSVPANLKRAIKGCPGVDWSAVATEAFQAKFRELAREESGDEASDDQ